MEDCRDNCSLRGYKEPSRRNCGGMDSDAFLGGHSGKGMGK